MPWLDATELRIGLGCMRLPANETRAVETVAAALGAGTTVLDTAHAYAAEVAGRGANERLLAGAVRAAGLKRRARIVTKGGMTRPGGAWVPDGRAKAIAADCEASLAALDGIPIDMYLLHAPDPRTPWRTSVRALGRLVDEALVARVGVANVTRAQLDEALQLAPIQAVQVALSPLDDGALRNGLVARCAEHGLTLIAHSPLGGPRRVGALTRRAEVAKIARGYSATAAEVALAWLLDLSDQIVPIPGATRPETARSAAHAATLELGAHDRAALTVAFGGPWRSPGERRTPKSARDQGEVVIVMGIPGAGKTRLANAYVERGYLRLNRDERGGSLRAVAAELERCLAGGAHRAILDNTYLTREGRSRVVDIAARHALGVRCIWLDTPLAQAQVNLVERLLTRFGSLPTPEQIREAARREPWLMLPTSQMRALRELEPPSMDEGFTAVEMVEFTRDPNRGGDSAVFIAAGAMSRDGAHGAIADADPSAPHLLFDWTPDGETVELRHVAAQLARAVSGSVELRACPHAAGPPACWCRPPLPGLLLAFARAYSVDPARSTVIGCSPAHRTLANTLCARYIAV